MQKKIVNSLDILHVWAIADTSKVLCNEMVKKGYNTKVMIRKDLDIIKFGEFKKDQTIYTSLPSSKWFLLKLLYFIKKKNVKIVHLHVVYRLARWIKKINPDVKLILHLHGSDIRGKWSELSEYLTRYSDKIVVSTPDLLIGAPQGVDYIPNPINRELFDSLEKQPENKKGLFMKLLYNQEKALSLAFQCQEKYNIDLTILDRDKNEIITYLEFPSFINQFTYFIDIKQGYTKDTNYILDDWSVTALQFLYLKKYVIRYEDGDFVVYHNHIDFVQIFDEIITKWQRIYEDLGL